jgi:cytochrome oxidase assembly protein ShyY1
VHQSGGIRLGEPDRIGNLEKPQLITYLDFEAISRTRGGSLSPRLILLDAADETGFSGRDWKPSVMMPAQHGAYAAQWFGLAIAITVTWVALAWRRGQEHRQSPDEKSKSSPGDKS